MLRALEIKADKVDDDVRIERGDALSERACRLFANPVDFHVPDIRPRVVRVIRLANAATRRNYFVSGFHQARNEVAADVTSRADYDDSDGYCRRAASKVAV